MPIISVITGESEAMKAVLFVLRSVKKLPVSSVILFNYRVNY